MSKKIKVLHIEDDLIDAILIREMLMSSDSGINFEVTHSDCIFDSLKLLNQDEFDLILLDLAVGPYNGINIVSLFRNLTPEIPVIMLTGSDNKSFAERSIQKGAQDYVIKGYMDAHFLSRTIKSAIQRHKGQMIALSHLDYDPITGCLNKKAFYDLALRKCQELKGNTILMLSMININNIKDIHYKYSEKFAVNGLKTVANYLKGLIKNNDAIAHSRYGTFFLLIEGKNHNALDVNKKFLQQISDFLKHLVLIDDNNHSINFSISIAYGLYPDHSNNVDNIFNKLEHTMYEMRHYGGKQMRIVKQSA